MKYFVTVLLTVSTVYSSSVFEDEGSKGLCLEPEVTYSICAAGSNLEAKVPAAAEACSNIETRKGKPQTLRQANGYEESYCPSFDEIMGYLTEEYGMEACILQNIGWLDDNMQENNATITEDMASLMPEFSSMISEDEINQCVMDTLADMAEDYEGCSNNFTDDELQTLQEVGMGITTYKCFERNFDNACNDYVYSTYVEPFLQSMYSGK